MASSPLERPLRLSPLPARGEGVGGEEDPRATIADLRNKLWRGNLAQDGKDFRLQTPGFRNCFSWSPGVWSLRPGNPLWFRLRRVRQAPHSDHRERIESHSAPSGQEREGEDGIVRVEKLASDWISRFSGLRGHS
jgi:hypothetical protein